MTKVYILHGICDSEEYYSNQYPSASNFHWIPWLQKQLMIKGYNCQTPEVPYLYKAKWNSWEETIDTLQIDKDTILVAHSAGCGAFLKWLSKNKDVCIDKLILVAPFIDPAKKYGDFLQCDLDKNLQDRIGDMHILYSKDEPVLNIKETVDIVMKQYSKTQYHEFENHGHFCLGDMGTEEFPDLLNIIVK
jgi:predicted alpha/beta hydrolase family esterase